MSVSYGNNEGYLYLRPLVALFRKQDTGFIILGCSFRPSGAPVAPLPPDASTVGLGCGSVMAVHRGPSTKWLFTREQLENTPSRRGGIEADRELSYRQQAANLIQDIGQRLNVYPLKRRG